MCFEYKNGLFSVLYWKIGVLYVFLYGFLYSDPSQEVVPKAQKYPLASLIIASLSIPLHSV